MRIFIRINIRILHVVTSADLQIRIIPPAATVYVKKRSFRPKNPYNQPLHSFHQKKNGSCKSQILHDSYMMRK